MASGFVSRCPFVAWRMVSCCRPSRKARPSTYRGLQARGIPNVCTLVGPQDGSAFYNVGVCGGLQAEWVTQMLYHIWAGKRRTLVYVGGGPEYRKRCEEVAYGGYEGFELA